MKRVQDALHKMHLENFGGSHELVSFDVVYCHVIDKFVSRDGCHFCSGLNGDYSDSNGIVKCDYDAEDGNRTHGAWTLEQMTKRLEKERERVRKEKEKNPPDKKRKERIIKERIGREDFARRMSRVSFEDMHRPFTI